MAKSEYSLEKLRVMDLSTLGRQELRKVYTVYRDALRKRIERLKYGSATQREYASRFGEGGAKEQLLWKLEKIDSLRREGWSEESLRRELLKRVQEQQSIEKSERSSLKGWTRIEARTIKSLQEHNYKIDKSNIGRFGEYMEAMREKFGTKIFPSEAVAELFSEVEAGDISNSEMLVALSELAGSSGVDLFA